MTIQDSQPAPTANEYFRLVERIRSEVHVRRELRTPAEVSCGAVWEDGAGKLAGDLETVHGPLSFRDATIGESIAPDPQLDMPMPALSENFREIREAICSEAEDYDRQGSMRFLLAIQKQLSECNELVEEKIATLSAAIECGDLLTPDTKVRRVLKVSARRVSENTVLPCDPDCDSTE